MNNKILRTRMFVLSSCMINADNILQKSEDCPPCLSCLENIYNLYTLNFFPLIRGVISLFLLLIQVVVGVDP
jgi:hypothetical protein